MTMDAHSVISPAILYWGTPVVLITSRNEDGTDNIAPMSSAWWLGHSCMLGLDTTSKTTQNILRTRECVLNLPNDTMSACINALAGATGSNPVSPSKRRRNYKFVKDKWTKSKLSPEPSSIVQPSRIVECPVQMECQLLQVTNLRPDLPDRCGIIVAVEVRVLRTHVSNTLRMDGHENRIDPDRWKPLIMSFQQFYGLKDDKIGPSVLGHIPEEEYRKLTKSDVTRVPGDDDDVLAVTKCRA
ncbi:uncharacterized protein JN550_010634 [Neoarthrinium moseri]|uniref:uncharacterized protein n=1 Tax=Neoarthrinium moseri TaxID=1658444 RepID=UPI001FDC5221|nr:uncharacterized protein JN550_010634 [Neoarthrinium moseri]KAI1862003.1 hypothetical protein JN550_010634 [Neoarthrinium moseri]